MVTTLTKVLPLTLPTLHKIMPHAPANFLVPLNAAMTVYQIDTPKRAAGFLSQLAVESHELRHTHELWTGRQNFHLQGVNRAVHTATSKKDYFKYWYGKRADLGNTTEMDGYTYRGRGAIQVTGKANYEKIGLGIGKPLKENPDLLESDLNVDMLAAAYFFARLKSLNVVADKVNPADKHSVAAVNASLTYSVNGGYNAQHERLSYFQKALTVMGA